MFKWFEQCSVAARLRVLGLMFVLGMLSTAGLASVLRWTTLLASAALMALSMWSLVEYMARDLMRARAQVLMTRYPASLPVSRADLLTLRADLDLSHDQAGTDALAQNLDQDQAKEISRLRMAGAI